MSNLRVVFILLIVSAGWTFCGASLSAENVVVVLLDDSGSMNDQMTAGRMTEPRMTVAKRALRKLVSQLKEDTQLGVLLLNGSAETGGWLVPLGKLDRQVAIARIDKVVADGGTPLGGSIKTAMDALLELRKKQPYGNYRLLVVTDGEATDPEVLQDYLNGIVARGVLIDVIGVDMKSDHSLANRSHSYRRADDEKGLERALTEVFAESSYDDNLDTAQADFDLIAGLPDELAQQALVALSELQDQPILPGASNAESAGDRPSNSGTGGVVESGSWICSLSCMVFILVIIAIAVNLLGKIMKK